LSIAIKTVKGKRYIYFSFQDQKKKVEEYCGPETDPTSLQKARQLKKKHLQSQIEVMRNQIHEIDTQDTAERGRK